MYIKRIQIANYGPIERLDITLPINDLAPLPIVLVGENGSGKSLFLSHIVNGLTFAQQQAFPQSPEVEADKVFKLRSAQYVAHGKEFSFARVDFADNLWTGELQLKRLKQDYGNETPKGIQGTDAEGLWKGMHETSSSWFDLGGFDNGFQVEKVFGSNCILFFPPDRFEDPAWLNEANLNARAEHVGNIRFVGSTDRKILNYSPLRGNQNWLFDLIYDANLLEPSPIGNRGHAAQLYQVVLAIVREMIVRKENVRLGIGPRHNRAVSIMSGNQVLVPNIFQLSSGEASLLNMFLSILRDYDLTRNRFTQAEDLAGVVVVDEIDLHLHSRYQYEVLPKLIKMFPKVQFIVTSHSPLFVLGLQEVLGEEGFGLYLLPEGQSISPEEFSEFGAAYQALANTRRHSDETRAAVREAQKPLIFVDGKTDVEYLKKAVELLGFGSLLDEAEFRDGGGMLGNIWKGVTKHHVEHKKVIVLHDPEENVHCQKRENVYRRRIGKLEDHPIQKGVENLFSKATMGRAGEDKPAFIDINPAGQGRERGAPVTISETWTVNADEKTNLCNWLCENGTAEDFQHFQPILEMLREIIEEVSEKPVE